MADSDPAVEPLGRVIGAALTLADALRPWALQPDPIRAACVELTLALVAFGDTLNDREA